MIIVFLLCISLSLWQVSRAFEKKQLFDTKIERGKNFIKLVPDMMPTTKSEVYNFDQQALTVEGVWVPDATIYIDNRSNEGVPGIHVLSALRLRDSKTVVWVNRGWAPKLPGSLENSNKYNEGILYLPKNDDTYSIYSGIAQTSLMRRIELAKDERLLRDGHLWQNLSWQELFRVCCGSAEGNSTIVMWPFIIWESSENNNGLTKVVPFIRIVMEKHIGYAIQWLLLGTLALFFSWRLSR